MDDMRQERDELAGLCGWVPGKRIDGSPGWYLPGVVLWVDHPFPYGDLNALAGAWPEGWGFTLNKNYANGDTGQWFASAVCLWGGPPLHREEVTRPERYDAELLCLLAVRRAMKEQAHA